MTGVILSVSEESQGAEPKTYSLKSYIAVVIAVRNHLFPFRTEKLSSPTMMVLPYQVGE